MVQIFGGGTVNSPLGTLVANADGSFFGTSEGGTSEATGGTVFTMSAAGDISPLHRFTGPDGAAPFAGVILGADGLLYGTTVAGGVPTGRGSGTVFSLAQDGSNFVSIHTFDFSTEGHDPKAELIQLSDGSLYGLTETSVFEAAPDGTVSVLQSFPGRTDLGGWQGPLLAIDDNTLLGVAARGSASQQGIVFQLVR